MISAKNLIKILWKFWAKELRQKWSHIMIEFNWNKTIIPLHSNKDLWKWLIKQIFDDLLIDEETEVYQVMMKNYK